ncbi:hypothetical protein N8561_01230 [bacterium]|nr:hypothetical protein [bacterium]
MIDKIFKPKFEQIFNNRTAFVWYSISFCVISSIAFLSNLSTTCKVKSDLMISDPLVVSGSSQFSSSLELLGFSNRTDESTLVKLLTSDLVLTGLSKEIQKDNLLSETSFAKNLQGHLSGLQTTPPIKIKQNRGDRFQDLSIFSIFFDVDSSKTERLNKVIMDYYVDFSVGYKKQLLGESEKYLAKQRQRMSDEYRQVTANLIDIRNKFGGLPPQVYTELLTQNLSSLRELKIQYEFGAYFDAPLNRDKDKDIKIRTFISNLPDKSIMLTSPFYSALQDYHNKLVSYIQIKSIYQPTSKQYQAALYSKKQSLSTLQDIVYIPRDIADQLPSSPLGIQILQETVKAEISNSSYDEKFREETARLGSNIIQSAEMSPTYIELESRTQSLLQIMGEYDKVIEKVRIDSAKGFSGWRYLSSKSICSGSPIWLLIVLAIPFPLFLKYYFRDKRTQ